MESEKLPWWFSGELIDAAVSDLPPTRSVLLSGTSPVADGEGEVSPDRAEALACLQLCQVLNMSDDTPLVVAKSRNDLLAAILKVRKPKGKAPVVATSTSERRGLDAAAKRAGYEVATVRKSDFYFEYRPSSVPGAHDARGVHISKSDAVQSKGCSVIVVESPDMTGELMYPSIVTRDLHRGKADNSNDLALVFDISNALTTQPLSDFETDIVGADVAHIADNAVARFEALLISSNLSLSDLPSVLWVVDLAAATGSTEGVAFAFASDRRLINRIGTQIRSENRNASVAGLLSAATQLKALDEGVLDQRMSNAVRNADYLKGWQLRDWMQGPVDIRSGGVAAISPTAILEGLLALLRYKAAAGEAKKFQEMCERYDIPSLIQSAIEKLAGVRLDRATVEGAEVLTFTIDQSQARLAEIAKRIDAFMRGPNGLVSGLYNEPKATLDELVRISSTPVDAIDEFLGQYLKPIDLARPTGPRIGDQTIWLDWEEQSLDRLYLVDFRTRAIGHDMLDDSIIYCRNLREVEQAARRPLAELVNVAQAAETLRSDVFFDSADVAELLCWWAELQRLRHPSVPEHNLRPSILHFGGSEFVMETNSPKRPAGRLNLAAADWETIIVERMELGPDGRQRVDRIIEAIKGEHPTMVIVDNPATFMGEPLTGDELRSIYEACGDALLVVDQSRGVVRRSNTPMVMAPDVLPHDGNWVFMSDGGPFSMGRRAFRSVRPHMNLLVYGGGCGDLPDLAPGIKRGQSPRDSTEAVTALADIVGVNATSFKDEARKILTLHGRLYQQIAESLRSQEDFHSLRFDSPYAFGQRAQPVSPLGPLTVVGGGIGGLAVAAWASSEGYDVTVIDNGNLWAKDNAERKTMSVAAAAQIVPYTHHTEPEIIERWRRYVAGSTWVYRTLSKWSEVTGVGESPYVDILPSGEEWPRQFTELVTSSEYPVSPPHEVPGPEGEPEKFDRYLDVGNCYWVETAEHLDFLRSALKANGVKLESRTVTKAEAIDSPDPMIVVPGVGVLDFIDEEAASNVTMTKGTTVVYEGIPSRVTKDNSRTRVAGYMVTAADMIFSPREGTAGPRIVVGSGSRPADDLATTHDDLHPLLERVQKLVSRPISRHIPPDPEAFEKPVAVRSGFRVYSKNGELVRRLGKNSLLVYGMEGDGWSIAWQLAREALAELTGKKIVPEQFARGSAHRSSIGTEAGLQSLN